MTRKEWVVGPHGAQIDIRFKLTEKTEMSEQQIEKMIQEKGLNAPRLAPVDIDNTIANVTYINLPNGRSVLCMITLKNGYDVFGFGHAASPANFDEAVGRERAFNEARQLIWPLEGYLLKQKLYEVARDNPEDHF